MRSPSLRMALAAIVALSVALQVHADKTWYDGTGNSGFSWNTPSNWTGDAVPDTTDVAIFSNLGVGTITLDSSPSVLGLSFTNTTGNYSITPGSGASLTIGTSGISISGNQDVDISANVVIGGNQNWAAGTQTLTVNGNVSFLNNVVTLTSGTIVLNGTNSNSSGGGVNVNGATLSIGSNSAFGTTAGGVLTLTSGTIQATGGTRTIANTTGVTVAGNIAIAGSNALNLQGAMNLGTSVRQFTVTNSATTTFSGVLSGTGGGIELLGGGTLVLSTATNSTFSGGVTVTNGKLVLTNGTTAVNGASSIAVGANGTLEIGNNLTKNIAFTAGGNVITTAGAPTLSGQLSGAVSSLGGSDLIISGTNSFSSLTIGHRVFINSVNSIPLNSTINVQAGGALASTTTAVNYVARNATVNVASGGNLGFRVAGTVIPTANLPSTGTLVVQYDDQSTGALFLVGDYRTLTGNLTIQTGAVTASGRLMSPTYQTGGFALGGADRTLTFNFVPSSGLNVNNILYTAQGNSALDAKLTLGGNGAVAFLGAFTGSTGSLRKTGTGSVYLRSSASTYEGATQIDGGLLVIDTLANGGANSSIGKSTSAASNLILGGGTLRYLGGTVSTDRSFTLSSATTSTIEIYDSAAAVTMSGSSASTDGGLTKSGPGTLVFTGSHNYTGTTTIRGGTLEIASTGSLSSSTPVTFTASGELKVNLSGATSLGAATFTTGNGTVTTIGTNTLMFASLGTRGVGATANFVSPGTPSNSNGILFTSAPTASQKIDKGYFFGGSNYAAYASGGFLRGLDYGTDSNTASVSSAIGAGDANKDVEITAAITGQATRTVASLKIGGAFDFAITAANTFTTPAILKTGGNSATISGGTALSNGNSELVIRVDQSSDTLIISSLISGTGALTKAGSGSLSLTTSANSFVGNINVNQGIFSFDADGRLGNTANDIFMYGGTLNPTATWAPGNGRVITIAGPSTLNVGGGTTTFGTAGQLTLNAKLTQTAGTAQLNAVVGGTGSYQIDGGTLILNVASALGGNTVLVSSGGTLQMGPSASVDPSNFLLSTNIDLNGGTFKALHGNNNYTPYGEFRVLANSTFDATTPASGSTNRTLTYGSLTFGPAVPTLAFTRSSGIYLDTSKFVGVNATNGGTIDIASTTAVEFNYLTMAGGTLTKSNGTGTLTISGYGMITSGSSVVNNAGMIILLGTGTETVTGAGTFTANNTATIRLDSALAASGGTLVANSGGVIQANAGVTANFLLGATIQLNTGGKLKTTHANVGSLTFGGNVQVLGDSTLEMDTVIQNAPLTFGTLSFGTGNKTLTTTRTGTLIDTAKFVNSSLGNSGILDVGANSPVELNGLTMAASTTLTKSTGTGTLTISGNNNSTAIPSTVNITNNAGTLVLNGNGTNTTIGAATVTANSGATVRIDAANSASGGTIVVNNGGILLSNSNAVANFLAGATVQMNTGGKTTIVHGNLAAITHGGDFQILGNSTLETTPVSQAQTMTFGTVDFGPGSPILSLTRANASFADSSIFTNSTLTNSGGFDAATGHGLTLNGLTFAGNRSLSFANSGGSYVIRGAFSGGANTLTLTGASAITVGNATSAASGTSGGLIINTSSTVSFSAANSFTGGVTVESGATAQNTVDNGIPTVGTLTVNTGGTFNLNAFNQSVLGLNGTGGSVNNSGAAKILTLTGSGTYSTSSVLSATTATNLLLNVNLGSGGVQTFNTANTYTGLTTVTAGTMKYGADNIISTGALTVVAGTLDMQTFSDSVAAVQITGAGTITGSGSATLTTTASFAASNSAGTAIVDVVLAGSGLQFTKTNAGTVRLNGANTFNGTATTYGFILTGGGVEVGNNAAFGPGAVQINGNTSIAAFGASRTVANRIDINGTNILTVGGSQAINLSGDIVAQNGGGDNRITANNRFIRLKRTLFRAGRGF